MTARRFKECPRLRALVGVEIGDGLDRRVIVAIESAGVLLDELAHREIWKRGSSAEACALHGGRPTWKDN